jgi:hypothetical protein
MIGILDRASWILNPLVVIGFPSPKLRRAFVYCPGLDEDKHGEFSQLGRLDELCILTYAHLHGFQYCSSHDQRYEFGKQNPSA